MEILERIWEWIKNDGVAVIISGITALGPYIIYRIRSSIKRRTDKENLTLAVLKEVANKEDVKPAVSALGEKIEDYKKYQEETTQKNVILAEMVAYAFNNSSLDPEIKDELELYVNKIKYGTDASEIEEILKDKQLLEEELEVVKKELEQLKKPKKIKVEKKDTKKIRR